MDIGNINLTPHCGQCGSNSLLVPDKMTDESIVTCESCGAENGTWGELQESAFRLAGEKIEEHVQDTFDEALKGIDGIEFKKSS